MKYFTYVLISKRDNNVYVGITDCMERRLYEHNSGKNRSTKARAPFEIIYTKESANREEARKHEKYLKSGFGRKFIKNKLLSKDVLIVINNPGSSAVG